MGTLYHTVVHLGSHFGSGQYGEDRAAENALIGAVWNKVFSKDAVQRVDGIPLWYYKDWRGGGNDTRSLLTPGTIDGQLVGNGQCTGWSYFMLDVLKAQGISRENVIVNVSPDLGVFEANNVPNPGGFLVRNWSFYGSKRSSAVTAVPAGAGYTRAELVGAYEYLIIPATSDGFNTEGNTYSLKYSDLAYDGAPKAKGPNPKSKANFGSHQFVQLDLGNGPEWFDPSYSVKYPGSTQQNRELAFDDGTLAAFTIKVEGAIVDETILGLDVDGDENVATCQTTVWFVRQNEMGRREIKSSTHNY